MLAQTAALGVLVGQNTRASGVKPEPGILRGVSFKEAGSDRASSSLMVRGIGGIWGSSAFRTSFCWRMTANVRKTMSFFAACSLIRSWRSRSPITILTLGYLLVTCFAFASDRTRAVYSYSGCFS